MDKLPVSLTDLKNAHPMAPMLLDMLCYMRPAGSETEERFIDRFIKPTGAVKDDYGNWWLDVGDNPTILFSCHTDTVHHKEGSQSLLFDPNDGMITVKVFADADETPDTDTVKYKKKITRLLKRVDTMGVSNMLELYQATMGFTYYGAEIKDSKGNPIPINEAALRKALVRVLTEELERAPARKKLTNCLGADDTTGVWLMLTMIKAGVEGRYVFHREEEVGGRGSSWVAKNRPEYLDGIKAAIAFDRKGYGDVITHQGSRCCSDEFAHSLAGLLGGAYKPDPSGVFTDTANYTDIVGECTNISVGYFGQHGPAESQHFGFAIGLAQTLAEADWSQLVFKREPGELEWLNHRGFSKSEPVDILEDFIWENTRDVALFLTSLGVTAEMLDKAIFEDDLLAEQDVNQALYQ